MAGRRILGRVHGTEPAMSGLLWFAAAIIIGVVLAVGLSMLLEAL